MIFNPKAVLIIAVFWITTALMSSCVEISISNPFTSAPNFPDTTETARANPAAYSPLHAADSQAERNALYPPDE